MRSGTASSLRPMRGAVCSVVGGRRFSAEGRVVLGAEGSLPETRTAAFCTFVTIAMRVIVIGIMRAVRSLTETDSTLLVQAPPWLGVLLIGVAIGLTVFALLRRPPRVARLGAFLATLVLLYVGWHAHAQRVTFEPRGFYVDGLYGEEERVG